MNRTHIGQLRKSYLKEQHPSLYRELKDDGVLDAHLRHVQGRALAYYVSLIEDGQCAGPAEEEVCQAIVFSCPRENRS